MKAKPEAPTEAPKPAKPTWSKLSNRLRVSAKTVDLWKRLPGAPAEPDYEQWKAFVKERGLGVVGNRVGKSRESLLTENLVKKNRLLDLEIANKERKSVDRGEVDSLLLHVAAMQKTVLFPALERELPPRAEGKTAAEIAILGREIGDRLCDVFTATIEAWKQG